MQIDINLNDTVQYNNGGMKSGVVKKIEPNYYQGRTRYTVIKDDDTSRALWDAGANIGHGVMFDDKGTLTV